MRGLGFRGFTVWECTNFGYVAEVLSSLRMLQLGLCGFMAVALTKRRASLESAQAKSFRVSPVSTLPYMPIGWEPTLNPRADPYQDLIFRSTNTGALMNRIGFGCMLYSHPHHDKI